MAFLALQSCGAGDEHVRRMMTGLAIVWLVSIGVLAVTQRSRPAAQAAEINVVKGTPP